jgi:hypothetical protein
LHLANSNILKPSQLSFKQTLELSENPAAVSQEFQRSKKMAPDFCSQRITANFRKTRSASRTHQRSFGNNMIGLARCLQDKTRKNADFEQLQSKYLKLLDLPDYAGTAWDNLVPRNVRQVIEK